MYERYFGLTEKPFAIAPDPRYLYMSEKHREALAHLLYGISNGGFVLLTGEVGTGKTTICRCLLEQLPAETELAFVFNPKLTAVELLEALCDEFRIGRPAGAAPSIKALIDRLNDHLLAQHAAGRTCVLIIDEAQNLSADVLEQMRLLTNLETNQRKLLQIIMIGQPELREMLLRPDLRQLAQRITARYHLRPLDRAEVAAYVGRRLQVAGVERQLFPPNVLAELYRYSGGVPRLINLIADRALLGAYVQGDVRVTPATLRRAAAEILDPPPAAPRRWPLVAGGATAAALAALALVIAEGGGWLEAAPQRLAAVWRSAASEPPLRAEASLAATVVAASPEARSEDQPVSAAPPAAGEEAVRGDVGEEPPVVLARAVVDAAEAPAKAEAVKPPALDAIAADSEGQAFRAVLARWGIDYGGGNPCAAAAAEGLTCLEETANLARLASLDRPAVLRLKDKEGRRRFAALVGIGADWVELDVGGETRRVATAELLAEWTGAYTLLWRKPPGYRWPVGLGTEDGVVAWIAKRLAGAAGGEAGEPQLLFDEKLRERVRQFQVSRQLGADGIVGPHTLIALDSATDSRGPRLSQASP